MLTPPSLGTGSAGKSVQRRSVEPTLTAARQTSNRLIGTAKSSYRRFHRRSATISHLRRFPRGRAEVPKVVATMINRRSGILAVSVILRGFPRECR